MGGGVVKDVKIFRVVMVEAGDERGAGGYGTGGWTVPEGEEVVEGGSRGAGCVDEGWVDVQFWDCHFSGWFGQMFLDL